MLHIRNGGAPTLFVLVFVLLTATVLHELLSKAGRPNSPPEKLGRLRRHADNGPRQFPSARLLSLAGKKLPTTIPSRPELCQRPRV
jgi:hypothetical protein